MFTKGKPSANPKGRPPSVLPRNGLAVITKLASRGVRDKDIARACGVSEMTFRKLRQGDQKIQDALDAGRQIQHDALIGKLYAKAMANDTVALIFALKILHNYRDNGDPTNSESKPQVIINLPGALPLDAYRKAITIEHEPQSMPRTLEVKRA